MLSMSIRTFRCLLPASLLAVAAGYACAQDVKVMSSGGFAPAYKQLGSAV